MAGGYAIKAEEVRVNTSGFSGNLDASDTDLQKVADAFDDLDVVESDPVWTSDKENYYTKVDIDSAAYLQSESDPVWTSEKGGYYTAIEIDEAAYLQSESDPIWGVDKARYQTTEQADGKYLQDSVADGKTYGRKDGAWSEVTTVETDPIWSSDKSSYYTAVEIDGAAYLQSESDPVWEVDKALYQTTEQSDAKYLQSESDPVWASEKSDYYTAVEIDGFAYLQSESDPLSLHLDQTTPQTITATDVTITAADEVYFGDVTDSTKIKKDTVQGILDLVPAPDLSAYAKLDGTNQPFTGDLYIRSDSKKLYLGDGDDASISYDGTNLVINPQEVGSGSLSISGDLAANNLSGTNTGDQDLSAYIQGSITSGYLPKSDGTKTFVDSSIYDNGNVGIGTSVPLSKLHVTGGSTTTASINAVPDTQGGCDAYTSLLLHFDGINGGTTFNDENCKGTGVKVGTATIATTSTDQIKFGTASAKFVGDPKISFPDSSEYAPLTSDFTVDFWYYPMGGTNDVIFNQYQTADKNQWLRIIGDDVTFIYQYTYPLAYAGATNSDVFTEKNKWYFVELNRSSGVIRVFVDGQNIPIATAWGNPGNNFPDISGNFNIGYSTPANSNFYIDEFRYSSGIARNTTNYTPPTKPYDPTPPVPVSKIQLQKNAVNTWDIKSDGADSDKFKIGNGSDRLVVDANGNLGIGTTSPSEKLDVVGDIEVSADIHNLSDNGKHYFGAGNDASITYNGTNLVINPKEVGSGVLDVSGTLQTDGYNSADGTAGATADVATLAPDGTTTRTLHFKNGLYTGYTDS